MATAWTVAGMNKICCWSLSKPRGWHPNPSGNPYYFGNLKDPARRGHYLFYHIVPEYFTLFNLFNLL
jgi:hypothetical protein